MHRAVRAARTFATYTTLTGAACIGTFLAVTRRSEFVPFPLEDDPIFISATYNKFNAFNKDAPGLHDYCVRKVPLKEIPEELLENNGKLVERFCGGVFGEFGYGIQRKYLQRKYRGPENSHHLWDPAALKSSSYPIGTCITDHFEVVERTPTRITLRAGDSPRIAGVRASDGVFELSADVKQDEGVVEFGIKSVFYKGDGPSPAMPTAVQWLHRMYTKLLVESGLSNVRK
ncbi:hypothetical protein C8F01DRAFT_1149364 [Mycena amicta]|nr:hypothetical protein C8F01DRAFT_1149364 [Mycena amicta]